MRVLLKYDDRELVVSLSPSDCKRTRADAICCPLSSVSVSLTQVYWRSRSKSERRWDGLANGFDAKTKKYSVDKKNQLDVTFCIFISLLIVA